MVGAHLSAGDWFILVQRELFLFTSVFFLLSALDELGVDCVYAWFRLTGRIRTPQVDERSLERSELKGRAAIFIPAWQEAVVIGPTLRHALASWPDGQLRVYVGCYRNDPATIASAMIAARGDPRVRVVVNDRDGPTCKADCLNRLYGALQEDEARWGERARMVVLHDAEDMVDPAALHAMDHALDAADFVQLPVLALPQAGSRWIAGHYCDEFAEAHGKVMVVRHALGAGIPGAGVGCAVSRAMLDRLTGAAGGLPFATSSLTEDYELGLNIKALGGRDHFLRLRTGDGRLIATRAYFPASRSDAIRQKTRWIHGIALQAWDRMGWRGGPAQLWMQLRDRRGPFAALLLGLAYFLLLSTTIGWGAARLGLVEPIRLSPIVVLMLLANLATLVWRALVRLAFTTREFGWREGLLAVPRIFVSNIVAIMAGRRALTAYVRSLGGAPVRWDKTEHLDHPALVPQGVVQA